MAVTLGSQLIRGVTALTPLHGDIRGDIPRRVCPRTSKGGVSPYLRSGVLERVAIGKTVPERMT